jgi:hypothetical protein
MSTYYRPSKPIRLDDIKNNEVLQEIGFEITNLKDKKYFCHEGNYIHFCFVMEAMMQIKYLYH